MRLLLLISLFAIILPVRAHDKDLVLFQSDSVLHLTIETDFDKIFKNPKDQNQRLEGFIKYTDIEGFSRIVRTRIEPRGGYRLDQSNCRFPPLSLKFPDDNNETVFEDVTKLKLVVHCRKAKRFEQYVVKEYLCYRLFNLLTDTSFRVRAARINYVNAPTGDTLYTRFGFFIERTRHIRDRMGCRKVRNKQTNIKWLNDYQAHRLSLFQYMIGNSDWSVYSGHNTKRMKSKGNYYAIPYDFDWSGFVNTTYAVPHPNYDIEDVTDRVYVGKELNKPVFQKVVEEFKQKKPELLHLVEKCPFLDKKNKRQALKYLEVFFERIKDEKCLNYYFFGRR
ncbi:MAG: hypothetical protein K9J27_01780 [Bacteroidales bacterium]|nr:hypothetical protein [Bacteroidales bacterium]MCF8332566.1 hypothetical protein [Bacteroidales bacterium]